MTETDKNTLPQTQVFKLAGLNKGSKGIYATIEMENEDWFHSDFDEQKWPINRQMALWDYMTAEGQKFDGSTAIVQFEKYSTDNAPINPKILTINIAL